MAHPRASRGRRGREIESTRWSGGSVLFSAQSAGTAAAVFINASADPPETLMRMRGELTAYLDSTSAPGGLIEVGIGVALVPEGSGTTVTWSPLTDDDAPWWYYDRFVLGYEEMVADVIDVPGITSFRKTIDVKGMRIIRPDVEAQIVVENVTLLNADGVNLQVSARVLFGST